MKLLATKPMKLLATKMATVRSQWCLAAGRYAMFPLVLLLVPNFSCSNHPLAPCPLDQHLERIRVASTDMRDMLAESCHGESFDTLSEFGGPVLVLLSDGTLTVDAGAAMDLRETNDVEALASSLRTYPWGASGIERGGADARLVSLFIDKGAKYDDIFTVLTACSLDSVRVSRVFCAFHQLHAEGASFITVHLIRSEDVGETPALIVGTDQGGGYSLLGDGVQGERFSLAEVLCTATRLISVRDEPPSEHIDQLRVGIRRTEGDDLALSAPFSLVVLFDVDARWQEMVRLLEAMHTLESEETTSRDFSLSWGGGFLLCE